MKNATLLAAAIAFSFNGFAQQNGTDKIEKAKMAPDNGLAISSYHVEETINMTFGGGKTTYEVSHLSLVNTNDLGQNNTRVVTPKYIKCKTNETATIVSELSEAKPVVEPLTVPPVTAAKVVRPDGKLTQASINIIETYERVLEKGYETVDMLKATGDYRFFAGDLVKAVRWYDRLFALTTDLDPVYYYRYSECLKAIGQTEKAAQMRAWFESKK
ncbi:hypothetical protein [Flavobacterium sp. XGLA_31]|uniref:hypothetical protein n=1 Tax=Flavobacterium sp. XGLA_31 TaxID=3447666 RepID=UPI003F39594D